MLQSEYGDVQIDLTTSTGKDRIIATVKALFVPKKTIIPSSLSIEIITLPNTRSVVLKSSPGTHSELAGKRHVQNWSTPDCAMWELFYNHPSEKYATWTVQGEFSNEDAKLLEINVCASIKQSIFHRLMLTPNCIHWSPLQTTFEK